MIILTRVYRSISKNALYIYYRCAADGAEITCAEGRNYRKITSTTSILDIGHYLRNYGWTHITQSTWDSLTDEEQYYLNSDFSNLQLVPDDYVGGVVDIEPVIIEPDKVVVIWSIFKVSDRMYISWSVFESGVRIQKEYDRLQRTTITVLEKHFKSRGYTHMTEKVYYGDINQDERIWLSEKFPDIEIVDNNYVGDELIEYIDEPDPTPQPIPDECDGMICPDICVGDDLHKGVCIDGYCIRGVLIEQDSLECGGIKPDPTPDPDDIEPDPEIDEPENNSNEIILYIIIGTILMGVLK